MTPAAPSFLRRWFNVIDLDNREEPWLGFRIGRLAVLIGTPYKTRNAFDNHVGWTPFAIQWQVRRG